MDELIEKLKAAPNTVKFGLAILLGIGYNVYSLSVDMPALEEKIIQAEQERENAKSLYSRAKSDAEKLYKLEVALKTIREQLEKAKKYLPDTIHIDEILHTTARFCKRYSVSLDNFAPQAEEPSQSEARYSIKPISITLSGRFVDIARFFDSMVHLQSIVHVRNVNLEKSTEANEEQRDNAVDLFRLTPEQRQKYSEQNTRVKATADLLLFRSEV